MRIKALLSGAAKMLLVTVFILILSCVLNVSMLFMTVVPFDFALVTVLLSDAYVFFLNLIPIATLIGFLYFVTSSFGAAFLTSSVIAFAIAQINRFKLFFRDEPFVFSDVFLVGEAGKMLETYKLSLETVSVVVLGVILFVTVLCFVFLSRLKAGKAQTRTAFGMIFLVLLVVLCRNFVCYEYSAYYKMWHEEFGNVYKDANQSMSRGVIYSFTRSIPKIIPTPPEGYDKNSVQSLLSDFNDTDIEEEKKVHIISIMLEAYNDFSRFEGVEFNYSPYTNFHRLCEDSISGKLYTNIFAGDTIKTERSFITGFGSSDISRITPSYASYFKSQGYYTEAMHPFYGWFYNRRTANEYLGFDSFEYYENCYADIPDEGLKDAKFYGMLSDSDFFDQIKSGLDEAIERGEHYFNFSVTYQNHGPYAAEKYTDIDYVIQPEGCPDSDINTINNYLSGIHRTDIALGELREYIDRLDAPCVLILFGDHNPLLGSENSVYHSLGINIDTETPDGAENYYCTPYLIYANDTAKRTLDRDFVGKGKTISPIFLMNEFFEYSGIGGSFYSNYLSTVRERYDVINTIYLKRDGEYVLRQSVGDDALLKERQNVEYYLTHHVPIKK